MLTTKFLRAHNIPVSTNGFAWFFRLIYEFWGFCVWGDNQLDAPGFAAFAPVSGVNFPAGFTTSGTLASGSDGYTTVGEPFFNTVSTSSFSASYVGKWLVTWRSGSTSTDDSIYQITQWFNSSSIRVNVFNGGTPYTGSLHPSFETRTNVNYRVVDFSAVGSMSTFTTNDNLILQFSDAYLVNPTQLASQAKLRKQTSTNSNVGITLSPSGSWSLISGTYQFSDPTTELLATDNAGGWFNGADSPAYISLWGAGDFLIAHYRGQQTAGSWFHIEIPQRLYTSGSDPNPIVMLNHGVFLPTFNDNARAYGGGYYMHHPPTNQTLRWAGLTRSQWGDNRFVRGSGLNPSTVSNGRYNGSIFNTYQNKFVFTDVTLGLLTTPQQYCLSRVRLRRIRAVCNIIPQFQRIGNNGEWIHVANGVMWPWDNTLLPYNLFSGGS